MFLVNSFWSLVMSQFSKILQSTHNFFTTPFYTFARDWDYRLTSILLNTLLFIFWKLNNLHFLSLFISHSSPSKENSDSYGSRKSITDLRVRAAMTERRILCLPNSSDFQTLFSSLSNSSSENLAVVHNWSRYNRSFSSWRKEIESLS